MADPAGVHRGEYSSTTSSDATPPNHLGGIVSSDQFDGHRDAEKVDHYGTLDLEKHEVLLEDDDDADMDALIEDLESDCGDMIDEEGAVEAGGAKPVPEDLLQTDTAIGLTEAEVTQRRKKFGLNQMKEEKPNHLLNFLGYFVGPIQFVMEVSRVGTDCNRSKWPHL
jgi:H+-transporting ATPase